MDYETYLDAVRGRFHGAESRGPLGSALFYEERFELKWLATKLKQSSFIAYSAEIDAATLRDYSADCFRFALDHRKGLPRGFQNGLVSFAVLAGDRVSPEAVAWAQSRPRKHFSAFEMPVIADLGAGRLFYFEETPLWGAIYYTYFRDYIEKKFAFPG